MTEHYLNMVDIFKIFLSNPKDFQKLTSLDLEFLADLIISINLESGESESDNFQIHKLKLSMWLIKIISLKNSQFNFDVVLKLLVKKTLNLIKVKSARSYVIAMLLKIIEEEPPNNDKYLENNRISIADMNIKMEDSASVDIKEMIKCIRESVANKEFYIHSYSSRPYEVKQISIDTSMSSNMLQEALMNFQHKAHNSIFKMSKNQDNTTDETQMSNVLFHRVLLKLLRESDGAAIIIETLETEFITTGIMSNLLTPKNVSFIHEWRSKQEMINKCYKSVNEIMSLLSLMRFCAFDVKFLGNVMRLSLSVIVVSYTYVLGNLDSKTANDSSEDMINDTMQFINDFISNFDQMFNDIHMKEPLRMFGVLNAIVFHKFMNEMNHVVSIDCLNLLSKNVQFLALSSTVLETLSSILERTDDESILNWKAEDQIMKTPLSLDDLLSMTSFSYKRWLCLLLNSETSNVMAYWMNSLHFNCCQLISTFNESKPVANEGFLKNSDSILYVDDDDGPGEEFGLDHLFTDYQDKPKVSVSEAALAARQESQSKSDNQKQFFKFIADTLKTISTLIMHEDATIKEMVRNQFDQSMVELVIKILKVIDRDVIQTREVFSNGTLFGLVKQFINFTNVLFSGFIGHSQSLYILSLLHIHTDIDQVPPQQYMDLELGPLILLVLMNISIIYTNTVAANVASSIPLITSDKYIRLMWTNMLFSMQNTILNDGDRLYDVSQEFLQFFLLIFHGLTSIQAKTEVVTLLLSSITASADNLQCLQPRLLARLLLSLNYLMHHFYEQAANLSFQLQFNLLTKYMNDSLNRETGSYQYEELQIFDDGINSLFYDVTVPWSVSRKNWPGSNNDTILLKQMLKDPNYDKFFTGVLSAIQLVFNQKYRPERLSKQPIVHFANSFYGVLSNWRLLDIVPPSANHPILMPDNVLSTFTELLYHLKFQHSVRRGKMVPLLKLIKDKQATEYSDDILQEESKAITLPEMTKYLSKVIDLCSVINGNKAGDDLSQQLFQMDVLLVLVNYVLVCAKEDLDAKKETDKMTLNSKCHLKDASDTDKNIWAVDCLEKLLQLYNSTSKQLESFIAKLHGSTLLHLDLSLLTRTNVELKLEPINMSSIKSLTSSLEQFFNKWSIEESTDEMSFVNMKRYLTKKSFDASFNIEYDNVVEMLRAEAHRRFIFIVDQVKVTTEATENMKLTMSTILVLIHDLRETISLVEACLGDNVPDSVQASYLDLAVLSSSNTFVPPPSTSVTKLLKAIPYPIYSQVITKKLIDIISELARTCSFSVSQCHYDVMIKSIDCLTQIFDQAMDVNSFKHIIGALIYREDNDDRQNNIAVIFSMIFADPASIPISIKCCLLKLVNLMLFRFKESRKEESLNQVLNPLHLEIHDITVGRGNKNMVQKVEKWLTDILEDTNMARLESRTEYLSQVILLAQLLATTSGNKDADSNFSTVIIKSILRMDERIRNGLTQYLQRFKSGSASDLPILNINVVIEVLCTVSNGCCPITLYVSVIQTLLDWIKEINRCICCYIDNKIGYTIHMDILCSTLARIYNHIGAVICALNDQYKVEETFEKNDDSCYIEQLHSNLYLHSFAMNQLGVDKKMVEDILYCSAKSNPYSNETDIISESEEDNKTKNSNLLNEQLCTFAATQKEFTEQHWYHCYTCSMIENEGVCTICAKVCHQQHDLSYAKRGSFFCDCGAKGSPFCEALSRRTSNETIKKVLPVKMQTQPLDLSKKELLQSRMQLAKREYNTLSAMNKLSKFSAMEKPLRKSLKTEAKIRTMDPRPCERLTQCESSGPSTSNKNDQIVNTVQLSKETEQLAYMSWVAKAMRNKLQSESETLTVLLDTSTLMDDCFSALKTVNHCFKDFYADWVVGRHKQLKESFVKVRNHEKTSERAKSIIGSSLHLRNTDAPNDLSGIPPTSALASDLSGANTQVRNMLQSGYVRRNVIAVVSPSSSTLLAEHYFLAVAQDKARIIIYKVSGLLEELYDTAVKKDDSNVDHERSLELESRQGLIEQVCTATLSFTVLSMCANPANNKYMSVCGLKEASVLTFTAMGSVSCKTAVTPVLEDSNQFLVRSLWLPGTTTYLVLILTQSVQIFDLSTSTTQPLYHFKSVESRFKDATFAFIAPNNSQTAAVDGSIRDCFVFVMSESGCIHCKKLDKECMGAAGFYLAEMLDWNPELYSMNRDIKTGVLGKGGSSIHYDHCLQLLFHSYNNGHTFCSVLDSGTDEIYVDKNYFLDIKSDTDQSLTLVDWSSNIDHPGLLTAISQHNNVPVYLSVEPDKYHYQLLDTVDSKCADSVDIPTETTNKVTDAITLSWKPRANKNQIRQQQERYTFSIVLFNDGKIKMLIANHKQEKTDGQFWLQERFTNSLLLDYLQGTDPNELPPKKQISKEKNVDVSKRCFRNDEIFLDDPSYGHIPVDFFEHCEQSKEVSFGGDRLLELYSQDVLNSRLLSQEQSVTMACKNPVSIVVTNKDPDSVIVGFRVGINVSDLTKVPKYFEIYNRKVPLPENLTRNRIVDIGMYKTEVLQSEKTAVLSVGPSKNSNDLIVIDFIKVFVRTRASLPWLKEKQIYFNSRNFFAPKKHVNNGHSFVEDINALTRKICISRRLRPALVNHHLPDIGLMSAGLQLITAFYHFKNTLNIEGKPTFSSSELVSSSSICSFANDLLCAFYPKEVTLNAITLLACVNSMKSLDGDLAPGFKRVSSSLSSNLAQTMFNHSSQAIYKIKSQASPDSVNFLTIEAHVVRLSHLINLHDLWISIDEDKFSSLSFMDVFDLMTACIDLITQYHATCSNINPRIESNAPVQIASDFVNPVYCHRLNYLPTIIPYVLKAMLSFVFSYHVDASVSAVSVRVKLTDLIISLLVTSNLMVSHNTRKSLNKFLKTCDRGISVIKPSVAQEQVTVDRELILDPLEKVSSLLIDDESGGLRLIESVMTSEQDEQGDSSVTNVALVQMEEPQQMSMHIQQQQQHHSTTELMFENDPDEGEIEENEYFCPAEEDWMVAVSNSESNSIGGAGNIANDALMFLLESVPGGVMPELMDNFDEQTMIDYAMKKSLEEQEGIVDITDGSQQASDDQQTSSTVVPLSTEDTSGDQQLSSNNAAAAATGLTDHNWHAKKPTKKAAKTEQFSTPDREYSDSNSGSDIGAFDVLKSPDQGPTAAAPHDLLMSIQKFGSHFLRQLCSEWSQLIPSLSGVRAVALFKSVLDVVRHMDMQETEARSLVEQLLELMLDFVLNAEGMILVDDSESNARQQNEIMCVILRALLNLVTSNSAKILSKTPKDDNNSTTPDLKQTLIVQSISSNCAEFIAIKLMHNKQLMRLCLSTMEQMVQYWRHKMVDKQAKSKSMETEGNNSPSAAVIHVEGRDTSITHSWLPDSDQSHSLQLLLIEVLLRLPYAVLKLCRTTIKDKKIGTEGVSSECDFMTDLANVVQKENKWHSILCEFIELGVSDSVTKASRTLLNSVVGAKHYRTVRDIHHIGGCVNKMKNLLDSHHVDRNSTRQVRLPFQETLKLLELVDCCLNKAKERPANWKVYCTKCPDILKFLMVHSISLDQTIALKLLYLLQLALLDIDSSKAKVGTTSSLKPVTEKNIAQKVALSTVNGGSKQESKLCRALASKVDIGVIVEFVRVYLCEYDNAGVRWLAEVILANLYSNGKGTFRSNMVDVLSDLWPTLRLSPQLADLTGHMIAKHPQWDRLDQFTDQLAASLSQAGLDLLTHHATPFYSYLQRLARLPGYYIDNEPCSYCPPSESGTELRIYRWHSEPTDNRRNQARAATITGMGLHTGSSIASVNGSDYLAPNVRASPTIHVFNLRAPYAMQSLSIKFSCPRRQRPQCAITVYYSHVSTVSTTQMLEQSHLWNKVRTVTITKDMAEVKLDFPVLLTAVYLIFEYDSFSGTTTGSDNVKCPRCHSATIQGNVCLNCRDNINQCYHCRAINYAGIDSFICSSCSSCRYAKIEFTMNAKPCFDFVEDLKSEESREVMINRINVWSETVDKNYQEMALLKQEFESLLEQVKMTDASEIICTKKPATPAASNASTMNAAASTKLIITGNRTYADMVGGTSLDDTGLQNRLYRRVRRPAGGESDADKEAATITPSSAKSPIAAPTTATATAPSSGAAASEQSKDEPKESSHTKNVHESLQQLVQKYCSDAKEHQIEMSCLWRQVWAAKKAVAKYDARLSTNNDYGSNTIEFNTTGESSLSIGRNSCYRCLLGKVQQLVWLLRGLSSLPDTRLAVADSAVSHELPSVLLGPLLDAVPSWLRQEIVPLVVQISLERPEEVVKLNTVITNELLGAMRAPFLSPEKETRVKTVLSLLRMSVASFDSLWEMRIRPPVAILRAAGYDQPLSSSHCAKLLVAPCVAMLQVCMRYLVTKSRHSAAGNVENDKTDEEQGSGLNVAQLPVVDIGRWIESDDALFKKWANTSRGQLSVPVKEDQVAEDMVLARKYASRWMAYKNSRVLARDTCCINLVNVEDVQVTQAWLWQALLSGPSKGQMNHLFIDMLAYRSTERHRLVLSVLVQCLPYMVAGVGADASDLLALCSKSGRSSGQQYLQQDQTLTLKYDLISNNEATTQYVLLIKRLSQERHWRCYLVLKCRLIELLALAITRVLESLSKMEEKCLSSWRWSQQVPGLVQGGWAAIHLLKNLTELLQHLQEQPSIGNKHRSTIVRCLLTASLNLRRLVIFRSKTTMDMETRFNKTVDDLSKDTEDIIRSFIKTAVDVLKQFPVTDLQSAGHIIERINAYVCPRDYEHPVFDVVLDIFKGQEDFLPHRMIGVSLNCHSFGRNPTVNDVINFLVRENGVTSDIRLDLICDKKVLMYDLLLEDIYQHVWLRSDTNNKSRPMRLTVRISGLVEDNLPYLKNLRQEVPIEHYQRSNELIGGGLLTIMQRLAAVDQLPHGFNVIASSVKLLHYFTNVTGNDARLIDADLNAVRVLLHCLLVCLKGGLDEKRMGEYEEATVVPLIELLSTILVLGRGGACNQEQLKGQSGGPDIVTSLISAIDAQSRVDLYQKYVTKIPSLLVFDSVEKMTIVLDYVTPHFMALTPNAIISDDQRHSLLACCEMVTAVPSDQYGVLFRQEMLRRGLLQICVDFLIAAAPAEALPEDGKLDLKKPETTVFLEQAALQFVLVLGRACVGDRNFPEAGRALLAVPGLIALLHKLETVKSVQAIGVLSEDWLNALEQCDTDVKTVISDARQRTQRNLRAQALKVRQKQLQDMKMTVNEKGQVLTTSSSMLRDLSSQLLEEPGNSCAICMDGYVNRPQESLGVYTFVRKVLVHDLMAAPGAGRSPPVPSTVACAGQYYYTSVSNFVWVHFSCHNQAVKVVNENEWVVAQRHNQNAKCNSLLPIMAPQYDANFKANLNRYQTSIWNNTNVPEINYQLIVHDLKFLLLRFSQGRQFNEDTGGGARLSNMRLVPQVVQIALANLLSQTDLVLKETQTFSKWQEQVGGWAKWFQQNLWQSTSVPYRVVQSLVFQGRDGWLQGRGQLLRLLLQYGHLRHLSVPDLGALQAASLPLEPLPFHVYQPFLMLFGLCHLIYTVYFKGVPSSASGKPWMEALSLYIREKEVSLLDDSTRMVRHYEDDLLPCESLQEFWDVVDLGQVQPYDDDYLGSVLLELKEAK